MPTRALANDKFAEWRAAGWDVGICTGDVNERPDARVIVATLETQRGTLLHGRGPKLLVIDEYQMLGDPHRGANYELSLALAPAHTQLLLLSGSVGNPGDVAAWLRRLGRDVELVTHLERPVPLEEAVLDALPYQVNIRAGGNGPGSGYWPRLVAKALLADLGPILAFAPRRLAAEEMARDLASALPVDDPLVLSPEQNALAGEKLAKLLRKRVAYHHSGLSYAARAGLIEPLAKSGQLRAVIATTGLAAGVNFSMRSVLITDTRYNVRHFERHLAPEELLQMFGRAGRRGLDESGFVLVAPGRPRLEDARPRNLKRATQIDWPTLVSVMDAARQRGEPPLAAASELCRRLFSVQDVPLGVERSVADGPRPCGLFVDAERSRLARPQSVEIFSSSGEWEPSGPDVQVPLAELWVTPREPAKKPPDQTLCHPERSVTESKDLAQRGTRAAFTAAPDMNPRPSGITPDASDRPRDVYHAGRGPSTPLHSAQDDNALEAQRASPVAPSTPAISWRPALHSSDFMRAIGRGNPCKLHRPATDHAPGGWRYGRELPLAVVINPNEVRLVKGLRATLETLSDEWRGRNFPAGGRLGRAVFEERLLPLVPSLTGGGTLWQLVERNGVLIAQVDYSSTAFPARRDATGRALHAPTERRNYPACCQHCPQQPVCESGNRDMTPALAWRKLGLIEADGTPTRRGVVFGFFHHGEGLAIAAALEQDERDYPVADLVYDLANLRAGHRFTPEGDNPHGGRLGGVCARVYQRADHPGYLEMGVPPDYGDGAAEAVRDMVEHPGNRNRLLNDLLRPGDLERVLTEWRSLIQHVAAAPDHAWERWRAFQAAARKHVASAGPGGLPVFPPLSMAQQRRYQHRLFLK